MYRVALKSLANARQGAFASGANQPPENSGPVAFKHTDCTDDDSKQLNKGTDTGAQGVR
jgi:hypothetical protein